MQKQQPGTHWPLTLITSITSLLNLALPLVLVRLLPPQQIGSYKIFFLYFGLLPWLLLFAGVNQSLAVWRSQTPQQQTTLYSTSWLVLHSWSLVIILLTFILGHTLQKDFLFYALGIGVALGSASQFFEESLIAHSQLRKGALWIATFEILKIVLLISVAYISRDIHLALKCFLLVILLKFILSVVLSLHLEFVKLSSINFSNLKTILPQILPLSLSASLAIIVGYTDHLILSRHLSLNEYALYAMGCLIIPPLYMLEQGINKQLLPHLSTAIKKSSQEAQKLISLAIAELSFFLIPASLGLFFFAKPIISLLFTSQYSEGANYLTVFAFSYLLFILPFDLVARAKGLNHWIFKFTLVSALIIGASLWTLKSLFAPRELLILMLLLQFVLRLYALDQSIHWLESEWKTLWPWKFQLKIIFLSLVLGSLTYTFYLQHPTQFFLIFQFFIFAFIYFYFALPWYFQIKSEIRQSPQKILLLTQYLHLGGLEKMLLNLAQDINPSRYHPLVCVYDKIPNTPIIDDQFSPISVFRINKKNGFSIRLVAQLLRLCWKNECYLIHAHDLGAFIYAALARLCSFGNIKVIYTVHSLVHLTKSKNYLWYEKIFYWLASKTVIVSQPLAQEYRHKITKYPVVVINNGIPITKIKAEIQPFSKSLLRKQFNFKFKIPNEDETKWLVSIARLHPGKGQAELIEIWSQLPVTIKKITHILFVGEETSLDYKNHLQRRIDQLGADHNLHLVGPSHEVLQWLKAADAFISGSQFEGLPLSVLEALAVNTPIILSNIAGHQIFQPVAHYLDTGSTEQGAQQLALALQNLDRFSAEQLDQCIKVFDIHAMTTQYENLYKQVSL